MKKLFQIIGFVVVVTLAFLLPILFGYSLGRWDVRLQIILFILTVIDWAVFAIRLGFEEGIW